MKDDILKLDTQKSLFPGITVSVDDKQFSCRKLVRDVMRRHYEWETEIAEASRGGDAQKVDDTIFNHVCFMFEIKPEVVNKLEADEIHLLMNKLVIEITRRKLERTAELLGVKNDVKKNIQPEKKIPSRSHSKSAKKRTAIGSKK